VILQGETLSKIFLDFQTIMCKNYENFFKIPEKARKNPFPHLQSWFVYEINFVAGGGGFLSKF